MNIGRRRDIAYVIAGLVALAALLFLVPPIPQDQAYHEFADARSILGIPNFWNVVSNLPFALIGIVGLSKLRGAINRVLFGGVLFTCFGSMYYHWSPSDSRLLWDRLPMALVFMAFLTAMVARVRSSRSSVFLLTCLLGCGIGSLLWWQITNDLRPYVFVQFGPMLVLLLMLRFGDSRHELCAILALYVLAKIAELSDNAFYSVLPISGHTLKHFLAALAAYAIYRLQWNGQLTSQVEPSMCAASAGTLRATPNY
jgi:Ceramidase